VDLEDRVPKDASLPASRGIVNATLSTLSDEFDGFGSPFGRERIPPKRLLRTLLVQAFYWIRSERQLVEQIEFDLLLRWFVVLGVDDPAWDATTFRKNRGPAAGRRCGGEVPGRRSGIDGVPTRHAGYAISLRIRKRIEETFGWAKSVAGLRKARPRGLPTFDRQFTFAMAAYDLVRLPKLLAALA
jgi:transposase